MRDEASRPAALGNLDLRSLANGTGGCPDLLNLDESPGRYGKLYLFGISEAMQFFAWNDTTVPTLPPAARIAPFLGFG